MDRSARRTGLFLVITGAILWGLVVPFQKNSFNNSQLM